MKDLHTFVKIEFVKNASPESVVNLLDKLEEQILELKEELKRERGAVDRAEKVNYDGADYSIVLFLRETQSQRKINMEDL